MGAVRYGNHKGHDFRNREPNLEIVRRKDHHLDPHSARDRLRNLDRSLQDRIKDTRREIRKREFTNGFNRSSKEIEVREPGELSSGSELDDSEATIVGGQDENFLASNGNRKFLPTVWDDKANEKKSCMDGIDIVGPLNPPVDHFKEDDEEIVTTRNIFSSRWANGSDVLEDDEDVFDEGFVRKRRKTDTLADSVVRELPKKMPTPELGEVLLGEYSDGSASRQSSSSGNRNDYMDAYDNKVNRSTDDDDNAMETDSETSIPVSPPRRNINMLQGCRSVTEFERLNRISEGTYGVVYRARDKKTGEIVALKKVKMEKEREGFPLTSLREILILLAFDHPSVVDVKEVVVGSELDSIFIVMEYMEHDLKGLMNTMKQPFSQSEVKCLMLQLLAGVKYLHDNWVLHRDLKTSNLLLNNHGELKICDFGLSRQYGSPLKPYTQLVVTLWYRAPELLLGAKEYSTGIDMWSLGCIMAELLAKEPLFSGKTEFDQLDKIFKTLGTPNEKIWPGFSKLPGVKANFVKQPYNKLREKFPPASFTGRPTLSEAGLDLLKKLLTYDPQKRITAEDALNHDWFRELPLPKSKDFMPTFPAQNAQDRCPRRVLKSPDPLEKLHRKELQEGKIGVGGLFG